ncbi:hypothetical protein O181_099637 [Austropuccinia psidii MF-1]|uniref:Uncharacterized protein n=1 Tax=Austropuccinia psidii MF-1 TaxID=1389203 RepID=A0A9Q3JDN7_9BASI|nr:hypothetical protein [Austropuccinia psidii MF-1]
MHPQQQDSPVPSFASSELTFHPFVEPSRHNEPPIPGPSQPFEPHEDALTCGPEPEVPQTKSMEEPFEPPRTPAPCSPHSHNEACQESTDLQPTLMIPQAIVHDSIQGILLEHCRLLHMIPFMDATH